jgi:hypothetical protein
MEIHRGDFIYCNPAKINRLLILHKTSINFAKLRNYRLVRPTTVIIYMAKARFNFRVIKANFFAAFAQRRFDGALMRISSPAGDTPGIAIMNPGCAQLEQDSPLIYKE